MMLPDPTDAGVAGEHHGRHALLRYRAGELQGEALSLTEAHLHSCEACARALADLRAEQAAFLATRTPAAFLAELVARRPKSPSFFARLMSVWMTPLCAAAASIAIVLLAQAPELGDDAPSLSTTRMKGAFALDFHVKTGDEVRLGQPGGVHHPGEQIQLSLSTPRRGYLLVVSLDSSGQVTPFYDRDGASIRVEPGTGQLLDGSVILDGALGPERVIGCLSYQPMKTSQVVLAGRHALRYARGDPSRVSRLPLACEQTGFLLDKRAP